MRLTTTFLAVEHENLQNAENAQRLEHFDQRKGTLKGFTGYTWIGLGKGAFEGINVMWGPAQDPANYPERRRVRVMIGSAQCWRARAAGFDAKLLAVRALDALEGVVLVQRPADDAVAIRRIDVAIDHWCYEWTRADLARFVTRAKCRASVEQGERMDPERREFIGPETATYYVGGRGAASRLLRVYNKVAEAAASGKLEWMERAWRAAGWDGTSTVWRAEIEHGGQWLHDHGFKDLSCLAGCERSLWSHYMEGVRHVKKKQTRLKSCTTSNVWNVLAASVASQPDTGCWEWVPRAPSQAADVDQLMAQAAGCLEAAIKAVRAGFLQPLGATGLAGLSGSEDDRDGELLALLHARILEKRAKEADTAIKRGKPLL